MGMITCMIIVCLFGFVVLRSFARASNDQSLFVMLAASGLTMQFGLQALINMGSALHLMPTKGMTLPFISYGGSSLLAIAFEMGCLLALTRRRPQATRFAAPIRLEPIDEAGRDLPTPHAA
jgi:cell division protein FtsW